MRQKHLETAFQSREEKLLRSLVVGRADFSIVLDEGGLGCGNVLTGRADGGGGASFRPLKLEVLQEVPDLGAVVVLHRYECKVNPET